MASRPIQANDIARAAIGDVGVKKLHVTHMPPTRKKTCAKCPFRPGVDVFTAFKLEVLKDEMRKRPNAVWMCHETSGGGSMPTEKSVICRGAVDWRTNGST